MNTIRKNITLGSASPRESPTGIKSQPTCASMANSAGSASRGLMAPMPICCPMSTPTTCATTAPGPMTGEIKGSPQISAITISPGKVLANGEMVWAIQLPRPDP